MGHNIFYVSAARVHWRKQTIIFKGKKCIHSIECLSPDEYKYYLSKILIRRKNQTNMTCNKIENITKDKNNDRLFNLYFKTFENNNEIFTELLLNYKMDNKKICKKSKYRKIEDQKINTLLKLIIKHQLKVVI